MTTKTFAYLVLGVFLSVSAHASVASAEGDAEWTSLYRGRESSFQDALNQQIRDICESYGIPYQMTEDRLILVPKKSRENILALIAGHYRK